jgi:pSer/pThr/pTyr-binding forkhead associated (FHA) protein
MTTYNNTSLSCIHPSACNYFSKILESTGDPKELWFIGRGTPPPPHPIDHLIKLDSPYLSRQHACLRYSTIDDYWQIRHIGSTHPTWLNGTRLTANEWHDITEGSIAKFAVEECKLIFSYYIEDTIQHLPFFESTEKLQQSSSTEQIIVPVSATPVSVTQESSINKTPFWQVAFIDQVFDELSALSNTKLIIYLMFFLAGLTIFLLYGAASIPNQPAVNQEAPHTFD